MKKEENSLRRGLTKPKLISKMADKIEINKLYKESDFDSQGFKLHSKFAKKWDRGILYDVLRYEKEQLIYIVYQMPNGLLCPIEHYDLQDGGMERSGNDITELLELSKVSSEVGK